MTVRRSQWRGWMPDDLDGCFTGLRQLRGRYITRTTQITSTRIEAATESASVLVWNRMTT